MDPLKEESNAQRALFKSKIDKWMSTRKTPDDDSNDSKYRALHLKKIHERHANHTAEIHTLNQKLEKFKDEVVISNILKRTDKVKMKWLEEKVKNAIPTKIAVKEKDFLIACLTNQIHQMMMQTVEWPQTKIDKQAIISKQTQKTQIGELNEQVDKLKREISESKAVIQWQKNQIMHLMNLLQGKPDQAQEIFSLKVKLKRFEQIIKQNAKNLAECAQQRVFYMDIFKEKVRLDEYYRKNATKGATGLRKNNQIMQLTKAKIMSPEKKKKRIKVVLSIHIKKAVAVSKSTDDEGEVIETGKNLESESEDKDKGKLKQTA